jgi:hypothetical protein
MVAKKVDDWSGKSRGEIAGILMTTLEDLGRVHHGGAVSADVSARLRRCLDILHDAIPEPGLVIRFRGSGDALAIEKLGGRITSAAIRKIVDSVDL